MKKTNNGRPLPATIPGPKPGDFPLGSLESRAAARAALGSSIEKSCICFPADEPPLLELKAEREAAKAVMCPLHGARFTQFAPHIWRAVRRPAHLEPQRWSWHSEQYIKAMKASFPPDRWPAEEVTDPDGTVRYVLKDGTELQRIELQPLHDNSDTQRKTVSAFQRNGLPYEIIVEIHDEIEDY